MSSPCTAAQYMLLIAFVVNSTRFEFYVVTRSYSSRPFLCALATPIPTYLPISVDYLPISHLFGAYRPYAGGVASRLATAVYVAMVTPILYDNSYSPNDSNLKYESYRPYG